MFTYDFYMYTSSVSQEMQSLPFKHVNSYLTFSQMPMTPRNRTPMIKQK